MVFGSGFQIFVVLSITLGGDGTRGRIEINIGVLAAFAANLDFDARVSDLDLTHCVTLLSEIDLQLINR